MNNSEHNCVSLKNAAFLFLFAFLEEILEIFEGGNEKLKIRFFLAVPLGLPGALLELTKTLGTSPGKLETLPMMTKKKEVRKK